MDSSSQDRVMKKAFSRGSGFRDGNLFLIGSKEGLGHLPLAFINPGDVALVPDPAYPVIRTQRCLRGENLI